MKDVLPFKIKPLKWKQLYNTAGDIMDVTCAECPFFGKRFYAEKPKDQARVDRNRARDITARIMAVIEIE